MRSADPQRKEDIRFVMAWLRTNASMMDAILASEPPIPEVEFVNKPVPPLLRQAFQQGEAESPRPRQLRVAPIHPAPGS